MKRLVVLLAALGAALSIPAANADADGCRDAVSSYNTALSSQSYNLQRYSRCLESSQGQDDCSSQFRRLRNTQSEIEWAVSSYQSECDDY
jgi:hypothetical protein